MLWVWRRSYILYTRNIWFLHFPYRRKNIQTKWMRCLFVNICIFSLFFSWYFHYFSSNICTRRVLVKERMPVNLSGHDIWYLQKGRSLSRKFIVLSENHPLPVILYRKSVYFSRCMLYIELYFFFLEWNFC